MAARSTLRRHPVAVGVLALALVAALVFALRLTFGPDLSARDPALADWMPLGYVARTWDIPPEVLATAAGVEPGSVPRRSLRRLAEDRGEPVGALIARLQAAIADHRRSDP